MSTNTQPSSRSLWILKLLVPVAAAVLTIGLIEAGFALFYPVPFSIDKNAYYEADRYTGYRLKPGGIGRYQAGIPVVANSQGLRDVEVPLDKPADVFRILVIGDSFTVGANVRQEEAYPKALERRLLSAYGHRIEVVNTGVGGWNPLEYAQYFDHYGYRYDPDLILVGFFVGNDTFDPRTEPGQTRTAILGHVVTREAVETPLISLKVFLHDHSNIARLLLNRRPPASESFTRKSCDDFTDWYLEIQRARMPNHLRSSDERRELARNSVDQVGRIAKRAGKGVPVIVILIPDENQVNPALQERLLKSEEASQYDFAMPQAMLTPMFRDIGIPTIDLLPAVLADGRCLYMNDTHWTPAGHELASSVIFDRLAPLLVRMGAVH